MSSGVVNDIASVDQFGKSSIIIFKIDRNKGKKEKKTEHTRIVAQLCSSVNAIFTSVVVYSRTTKNKPNKRNNGWSQIQLVMLLVRFVNNVVWNAKKRKKTEHTRIVAQLCSSTSAIFTSVVVYSRTSKRTKQECTKLVVNNCWYSCSMFVSSYICKVVNKVVLRNNVNVFCFIRLKWR